MGVLCVERSEKVTMATMQAPTTQYRCTGNFSGNPNTYRTPYFLLGDELFALQTVLITRLSLSSQFNVISLCYLFQVLFDALGCLRKYETPLDILKEFFELRLERYAMRKAWLDGLLTSESSKLSNQARFILEKIEGEIILGEGFIIGFNLLTNFVCIKLTKAPFKYQTLHVPNLIKIGLNRRFCLFVLGWHMQRSKVNWV